MTGSIASVRKKAERPELKESPDFLPTTMGCSAPAHRYLAQGLSTPNYAVRRSVPRAFTDSLRRGAGDALLKIAAQRIVKCMGDVDTLRRVRDGEFALVLQGTNGDRENGAAMAGKRVSAVCFFSSSVALRDGERFLACSLGVGLYPRDENSEKVGLRNAHAALHPAKQLGVNNCQIHNLEANVAAEECNSFDTALRIPTNRAYTTARPSILVAQE